MRQPAHGPVVRKADAGPFEASASVDPHLVGTVHEHIGHSLEPEQRLERTGTHDVAVHIAAYSPTYLTREDVPAELVESERRIADETARAEGKPEQALTKIVEGRLTGFFKEGVLVDQAFAKDAKKSVAAVLTEADAKATAFARFRVGA